MYKYIIYILCYVVYLIERSESYIVPLHCPCHDSCSNQTPIVAPAALASWCVPPVLGATSCTPQVAE